MKTSTLLLGAVAVAATTAASWAIAADHLDSPAATADPPADITDVYSWVDGNNVVFALDVVPLAGPTSKFSDQVQYALHTASGTAFGMASQKLDIICTFDASQTAQCWAGSQEYVTGDASKPEGITSASGKLRVFAGLRADPFFFNLAGFRDAVSAVDAVEGALHYDAAGCPALDAATAAGLVARLQHDPATGGPAKNFFAGKDVMAIVVAVDRSLVTTGGPLMSVWAGTYKAGG